MKINKGPLAILLTTLIFSAFGAIVAIVGKDFTSLQLSLIVYCIGTVCFGIVNLVKKNILFIFQTPKNYLFLIFFCIINALPILFFIESTRSASLGVVYTVQNSITLFASLLIGYFIFKERKHIKLVFILIIFIILGLIILLNPYFDNNFALRGVFFAGLTGIVNAFSNALRRKLTFTSKPEVVGFFSNTIGFLFYLGLNIIFETHKLDLQQTSFIVLFIYSFFSALTDFLLNYGFTKTNFVLGNMILSLEVLFSIFVGSLLNQTLQISQIGAILVIFLAIIFVQKYSASKS